MFGVVLPRYQEGVSMTLVHQPCSSLHTDHSTPEATPTLDEDRSELLHEFRTELTLPYPITLSLHQVPRYLLLHAGPL